MRRWRLVGAGCEGAIKSDGLAGGVIEQVDDGDGNVLAVGGFVGRGVGWRCLVCDLQS